VGGGKKKIKTKTRGHRGNLQHAKNGTKTKQRKRVEKEWGKCKALPRPKDGPTKGERVKMAGVQSKGRIKETNRKTFKGSEGKKPYKLQKLFLGFSWGTEEKGSLKTLVNKGRLEKKRLVKIKDRGRRPTRDTRKNVDGKRPRIFENERC